jgi:hypothetical protein
LDAERSFDRSLHICADQSAGDFFAGAAARPADCTRTCFFAPDHQALLCQAIEVQLQAILQACSLSLSRHLPSSQFVFLWTDLADLARYAFSRCNGRSRVDRANRRLEIGGTQFSRFRMLTADGSDRRQRTSA